MINRPRDFATNSLICIESRSKLLRSHTLLEMSQSTYMSTIGGSAQQSLLLERNFAHGPLIGTPRLLDKAETLSENHIHLLHLRHLENNNFEAKLESEYTGHLNPFEWKVRFRIGRLRTRSNPEWWLVVVNHGIVTSFQLSNTELARCLADVAFWPAA